MKVAMREVPSKATWYDYKMAVVGTLMDNGMSLRVIDGVIVVYRGWFKDKSTVYTQKLTGRGWVKFYEEDLPKILKGEKAE